MCCDVCTRYDECDEKDKLRDDCCAQCPEYKYCMGEEKKENNEESYPDDKDTKTDGETPYEY